MMAGKGSAWRQGEVRKKFGENEEFWNSSEEKKKTECWKCNASWKCLNAYKENKCIGLEIGDK